MKKKYNKLLWTIGLGEMIMALTTIVDLIEISRLGTKYMAGYALGVTFVSALYLCYDALNTFIYVEYAKNKDTKVLNIGSRLSIIAQLITIGIVLIALVILLKISGLSREANKVAMIVVIGRSIGSIVFTFTTVYYAYYRSEGKEKVATNTRLFASLLNVVLDILAIVFKLGVIGVISATILSEISEYLILKLYSVIHKIKFKKSSWKEVRSYIKVMLKGYGVQVILRVQYILCGVAASYLGDEGYAVYGIVQTICGQFLWFVYANDMVVEIIYGEFKKLYSLMDIFKEMLKMGAVSSLKYWLLTLLLTPIIIKISTYDNGLKVSLIWMTALNLIWIVLETCASITNGFLYIIDKYDKKMLLEGLGIIVITVSTYLLTLTKDPYITYLFGWLGTYLINLKVGKRIIEGSGR